MGSVRTLASRGTLFLDFRYAGKRCREYTALVDTPANRKRVEKVLLAIESEIAAGTFVYATYFPSSAAPKVASAAPPHSTAAMATADGQPSVSGPASASRSTPGFRDTATHWLKAHEVEWRRSYRETMQSTVETHLCGFFGDQQVHTITRNQVLELRRQLATLPGRAGKAGLSNRRINGILTPLRQILNEAAEEHSFMSPMTTLKPLKIRKTDVEPFTLDEVQAILKTARADYRDYFTVRFLTGMRTGEAHGLKWKYVDFASRLILIRETVVLGEDEYTKTDGSQREIQMSQVVFEALQRQHAATSGVSEYVFCNTVGNSLDNQNFTDRVWNPLLRHLGLKVRRPYQMRHTAATLWLAAGEAPEWIARQLGHSSTEMLFRVYSRYVPNLTRRDGSAFERLLASRFSSGQIQVPAHEQGSADSAPRPTARPDGAEVPPPAQPPPAPSVQPVLMH
ncbi:site-specific integrase [Roseateles toxinivorans]|uniref:Integrase n=1 Tax=Roseateles toxinivorans TaxID=270368 RepID=A0A4R6QCE7_9BURK|nr:site-specific integrase [Roseateles toxinivorans]TDP60444.1 integrase [Roseateles toxinivorans]